ncbi:MAG: hypothetical protein JRN12_02265 [Nitrososphaerota archaeon]|jgi:hypothetical protein|nr:hypothetical protein [Nitrososphaerota archaeon]MDG6942938.1 hypothetical protein [Nitrososphaerota archaeon]MDG6950666.1 hypothetical protein [Nitrososphaerota archaeon]
MSLLASTEEAEFAVKAWLQKKYGKRLGRVRFFEVMKEGDVWTVKANLKLVSGVLMAKPYFVQVKVDSNSTQVLGYSEAEIEK